MTRLGHALNALAAMAGLVALGAMVAAAGHVIGGKPNADLERAMLARWDAELAVAQLTEHHGLTPPAGGD